MKLLIDTDTMTVQEFIDAPVSSSWVDPVELMEEHSGTKEYTGVVADIQKWYYGSLVKAAWCATAVSYFMNKAGCLDLIGGKAENVKTMLDNCIRKGNGQVFMHDELYNGFQIKQSDILFWLWEDLDDGKIHAMTTTSSKHVGFAKTDCSGDIVLCIGGNQSDKICPKLYNKKNLYAVFRPNYDRS